jgi:hypothetical protein
MSLQLENEARAAYEKIPAETRMVLALPGLPIDSH